MKRAFPGAQLDDESPKKRARLGSDSESSEDEKDVEAVLLGPDGDFQTVSISVENGATCGYLPIDGELKRILGHEPHPDEDFWSIHQVVFNVFGCTDESLPLNPHATTLAKRFSFCQENGERTYRGPLLICNSECASLSPTEWTIVKTAV